MRKLTEYPNFNMPFSATVIGKVVFSAVLMTVVMGALLLSSCTDTPIDPHEQSVTFNHPDQNWQQQLGDNLKQLSDEEQRLLTNYALRLRNQASQVPRSEDLNQAHTKASSADAAQTITVAQAIHAQRSYEAQHPYNPTAKQLTASERYPIFVISMPPQPPALLAKQMPADSIIEGYEHHSRWQLGLLNLGEHQVKTFEGTLRIVPKTPPASTAPLPALPDIQVPLTQFVPPIALNAYGTFIAEIPVQMKDALITQPPTHPEQLQLEITKGTLVLTNGDIISIK